MLCHISSIVQIIFSILSFEIIESILRNQKFLMGLDSFSNQHLFIWLCLDKTSPFSTSPFSTILLKVAKLLCFTLALFSKSRGSLKRLK